MRRTQRHEVSLRRQRRRREDIFPRDQDPGIRRHRIQQVHSGYQCPWYCSNWKERHWQKSANKSDGKLHFSVLACFRFDNGNSTFSGNYHLDSGELLCSYIINLPHSNAKAENKHLMKALERLLAFNQLHTETTSTTSYRMLYSTIYMKVRLNSFHVNGHTLGLLPQT